MRVCMNRGCVCVFRCVLLFLWMMHCSAWNSISKGIRERVKHAHMHPHTHTAFPFNCISYASCKLKPVWPFFLYLSSKQDISDHKTVPIKFYRLLCVRIPHKLTIVCLALANTETFLPIGLSDVKFNSSSWPLSEWFNAALDNYTNNHAYRCSL